MAYIPLSRFGLYSDTGIMEGEEKQYSAFGSDASLVRTMHEDLAELSRTTQSTILKTTDREHKKPAPDKKNTHGPLFVLLIFTIFILLGGSGYYLLPFLSKKEPTRPKELVEPAPLFATEAREMIEARSDEPTSLMQKIDRLSRQAGQPGSIKRILIKLRDGPEDRFADLIDFFELYKLKPPPQFFDNLEKNLMPFIYQGEDGGYFGIALKTKDQDRTQKDMLLWEPSMFSDIRILLFGRSYDATPIQFEDRIYRNIDWRYLSLSKEKNLGIGYMVFPSQNVLVLTTNMASMEAIVDRLFNTQ